MPTDDRAIYGGIPLRAARDDRLSERHFRALTVIAAKNRHGKTGKISLGFDGESGRFNMLQKGVYDDR